MSHSLTELEAMCKRAARGAGLSWGLAEEAAKAGGWLCALGLPGARMLLRRLTLLDGQSLAGLTPSSLSGECSSTSGRLCPLIAGVTISDSVTALLSGQVWRLEQVVCPLLTVPFVSDAALHIDAPLSVEWSTVRLTTDGYCLGIEGTHASLEIECADVLRCGLTDSLSSPSLSPGQRAHVDADVWAALSGFAERTYAPATEESRRRGAGGADGD